MTVLRKQGELRQRGDVYRSKPYRQHVARQPCEACGYAARNSDGYCTQAAHIRGGFYGMGEKPSDRCLISLCAERPDNRGCHRRFDAGQAVFARKTWGLTIAELIERAEERWDMWFATRNR